eukprot:scaffold346_cov387-Prasinococcus_capsulatus_cf.AAC.3
MAAAGAAPLTLSEKLMVRVPRSRDVAPERRRSPSVSVARWVASDDCACAPPASLPRNQPAVHNFHTRDHGV